MSRGPWKHKEPPLEATAIPPRRTIAGMVRCLAPGPEHWWFSPDRKGRRTCPKCEADMGGIPPILLRPPLSTRPGAV